MVNRRRIGENKIYLIVAVFVLLVIIFAIIFTSSHFTPAIIHNNFLDNGWDENIEEREQDLQLLSNWYSYTYENFNDSYPAFVTVTSQKSLLMKSEEELISDTIIAIKDASDQGIYIDETTKISGNRVVLDGEHKTEYVVYNGTDNSSGIDEDIKIIGETWNCGISGASIICIGVAQVTDKTHNNQEIVTSYWSKIVRDKKGTFGVGNFIGDEGLIFNVKCH